MELTHLSELLQESETSAIGCSKLGGGGFLLLFHLTSCLPEITGGPSKRVWRHFHPFEKSVIQRKTRNNFGRLVNIKTLVARLDD